MNMLNSILYGGKEYEVKLIAYAGKATHIIFREDKFYIYISNKSSGSKVLQEALRQLRLWMIEKAEERIKRGAEEFGKSIGVTYNNIRIKDTKTRWGSCSSKGNLNFNFRIVMAPKAAMDYIIVHELCHLKHMNHSKEFWKTVEQHMPDYETYKEWLKKNGLKLYTLW
ncbi:MAG: hypothetical protein A2Y23_15615 [Clostridiales bacterium GWB2_37_7]|nr:MAG: hypothetical protein A2Y23_15615 [Clostridiales bacterium GWB2_37_7]